MTTIIILNLATYSPDISDYVRMWNGLYAEERLQTVKIKVLYKWMALNNYQQGDVSFLSSSTSRCIFFFPFFFPFLIPSFNGHMLSMC